MSGWHRKNIKRHSRGNVFSIDKLYLREARGAARV